MICYLFWLPKEKQGIEMNRTFTLILTLQRYKKDSVCYNWPKHMLTKAIKVTKLNFHLMGRHSSLFIVSS